MGIREKLRVFGNDYNTLMELAHETTYMLLIWLKPMWQP